MSRDDIHAMMDTLGGLPDVLHHADPADKAEVYRELGVRLAYDHMDRTVLAETQPDIIRVRSVCVRGGLDHYAHVLNQQTPGSGVVPSTAAIDGPKSLTRIDNVRQRGEPSR